MRRAVLDVGSNSILLIVAELHNDGWSTLLETTAVTGLGTGVKTTGVLQPDQMEVSLAAIRAAFDEAQMLGAECRAYGTMALRIARNAGEFLRAAEQQGTPVTVISGEQEALLGVRSVVLDPKFGSHDLVSVIDPGGHSTEVSIARRTADSYETKYSMSVPIGTLGLIDTCEWSESPDAKQQFAASIAIDYALGDGLVGEPTSVAIALGATPTVLVSIRDALAEWDAKKIHGKSLSFEEVSRSVGWLCGLSLAQRATLVGMEPGREGTIHAGALILERFMNALRVEGCLVSCRGWRFALLDGEI